MAKFSQAEREALITKMRPWMPKGTALCFFWHHTIYDGDQAPLYHYWRVFVQDGTALKKVNRELALLGMGRLAEETDTLPELLVTNLGYVEIRRALGRMFYGEDEAFLEKVW
jgi:hypothetical protein